MKKRYPLVFLALFSFLIVACNRHLLSTDKGDQLIIFPAPPDTARIQFLTSINQSTDVTGQRKGLSWFVLGEKASMPLVKPYGLAVHKGQLFVCDAGVSGLEIINLEQKGFEYFVPKGKGQLKSPANCCTDPEGNLYVADPGRRQVVVFDKDLKYLWAVGGTEESRPTDVAVWNGKVFVPEARMHRVDVYDKESRALLYSIPENPEPGSEGYLYQPVNIHVTDKGVYVTDFGDFKVKIFSHTGSFQSSIGSFGTTTGQFVRPKGLGTDRDENLFVVDAGFENVQMFNPAGQLLMFFGGPYKGPGDMYLPAKVVVDYDHLLYFQKYVDPGYRLKYLIFVTNQYGPSKINVYGAIEAK